MSSENVLDRYIAQAEATLSAAAGSASLCSVSRSGVPMPGVKYPEGAWVALRDVRRLMRSTGDLGSSVREVSAEWSSGLAKHEQAGSGPDWISYFTGGIDALAALVESLSTSDGTSSN